MATKQILFQLYPNKTQETKLHYWRKLHCLLYNAGVANRKTQYQKFGQSGLTILSNKTVYLSLKKCGLNMSN